MSNAKCTLRFQTSHHNLKHFAKTKEQMCHIKFNLITMCEIFGKVCVVWFFFFFLQAECVMSLGELETTDGL